MDAKQIVSPTTAYMITNMLGAVIERGTAKKARGTAKGTALAEKLASQSAGRANAAPSPQDNEPTK